MKKLRLLIVIALIGMTLASCGAKNEVKDNESKPEGNSQTSSNPEQKPEESTSAQTDPTTSQTPEPSDPSSKANEKKMFGVKFLGSELDQAAREELLGKNLTEEQRKELTVVEQPGTECYLIIPKDKVIMTVYELNLGNEGLTRGGVLAQSTQGGALYLTCNVSDIAPNTIIVIQDGNTEYTYTPFISLKDGQVELGEWGYAF